jgi:RimJ/RimL family protein N-acetyltransferase
MIGAGEFYLSPSPTPVDVRTVSELAQQTGERFFYAPLTIPVRAGTVFAVKAATAVLLGGMKHEVHAIIVRMAESDKFAGCVRLFDIHAGASAKLGYFFRPDLHGRKLGTQSVLRALDFMTGDEQICERLGLLRIEATFDPDNTASFLILQKSGFKVTGFLDSVSSPYLGFHGTRRPRVVMTGDIRDDIMPALSMARSGGHYSRETRVR